MMNQVIMNSVMFTVFDKMKDAANRSEVLSANSSALAAGLFAGFATACISTPTDWMKIQAQMSLSENAHSRKRQYIQQSTRYDVLSIMRRNAMKDGKFNFALFARTLYSGHMANLGREGVFTMVYLGLYDRISHSVKERRTQYDSDFHYDQPLSMGTVILVSSFTGACAWICNYPFDTIKTVMQAQLHGRVTFGCAMRTLYKSGGWKAFWRGAPQSTFRAMLVTSSRMLAYEKTVQLLG